MALLIVGTANHCVYEDLFLSFSRVVLGAEAPEHLPNHLESNASHQHNDSSEPHEHGQPHPVLAIHFDKATADILKLRIAITSLSLVALCSVELAFVEGITEGVLPFTTGDPPGILGQFISSLTIAPHAPPI